MKKVWIFLIVGVFLVGLGTAAWIFSIDTGFNFNIISLPGYAKLDIDMPSLSVNTTEGIGIDTAYTTFLVNKDMTMSVSITEEFQDDSGGECIDGENDCLVTYYIEDELNSFIEIEDEDSIDFTAMSVQRKLNATLSCEAYSCPQSRSVDIKLTEVL